MALRAVLGVSVGALATPLALEAADPRGRLRGRPGLVAAAVAGLVPAVLLRGVSL